MSVNETELKIKTLFEKLDSLAKQFNEHDKWAAGHSATVENDIKHLTTELLQLREEQRIQQNQLHVNAEQNNEERYKMKEQLKTEMTDISATLSDEIIKSEDSAIKKSNSYTNRGVSIAVATVVLLFGLIETIYYITQIAPSLGGHH